MTNEDDIRISYQSAIDMANHEGRAVWARFNIILVANSILLLSASISSSSQSFPGPFLPIGGLILCVLWLFLMARGFTYETFYIVLARRLEQELAIDPTHRVLNVGRQLSNGERVQVDQDTIQMSPLARVNARIVVYILIGLFIAAYVYLLSTSALIYSVIIYVIVLLIDRVAVSNRGDLR